MTPADVYLVILATLAIPWAGWVSLKLIQLDRDVAASDARQDSQLQDHEERLNELEHLFPRQVPNRA